MAHAITFDTLAFAKKIEASGLEPKQAEAIAVALSDVFDSSRGAKRKTSKFPSTYLFLLN